MQSIAITKELDLVQTYTIFDDLIALLKLQTPKPGMKPKLNLAEVSTISMIKNRYKIKDWKSLFRLLQDKYSEDFDLPDYKNFVETMNRSAVDLLVIMNFLLQVNTHRSSKIKLVDSTPIPVCKNIRIEYHKTMRTIASRSKGTMGWFYGMKLHAVTDIKGNLLGIKLTTGKVGDRKILEEFLRNFYDSIIIADAGYCSSKLEKEANKNNNVLKTCKRKNMKSIATNIDIKQLNLRNRIEVVFSVLKERLNLITSLPRSVNGYIAYYIHVIFGYTVSKFNS